MMKRLSLVLMALCLCLLTNQPCLAQTEKDYSWVNEHFPGVLKQMLPNDEGTGWRVGFTVYRDLYTDVLEYSCVFKESWPESSNGLVVVVRMADAKSLYDQMMALHRENRAAGIDQIKSKLKVKEWRLTEKSCPAARNLYAAFYNLKLPMLSVKDRADFTKGTINIIEHPLLYNIHAFISGGDVELLLAGQEHPLVKWANGTRSELDACIKNSKK